MYENPKSENIGPPAVVIYTSCSALHSPTGRPFSYRNVIPETETFSRYSLRSEGKDKSQNGAAITIVSALENLRAW